MSDRQIISFFIFVLLFSTWAVHRNVSCGIPQTPHIEGGGQLTKSEKLGEVREAQDKPLSSANTKRSVHPSGHCVNSNQIKHLKG